MKDAVVRLDGIHISNFKNVISGHLNFTNNRKAYRASILGLYGQNGSGKTALIDAIELLQSALRGRAVHAKFADQINVGADSARIRYDFLVISEDRRYFASYEIVLRSEDAEQSQQTDDDEPHRMVIIAEECLSCSYEDEDLKIRKSNLIDTSSQKIFQPEGKYACLVGRSKETALDLMVAKKLAQRTSRSFIFSKELLTAMRSNTANKDDPEYRRHMFLIESLVRYGAFELFVINTTNSGAISMDILPISFRYDGDLNGVVGNILLPLDKPMIIPIDDIEIVERVIANMNIVLSEIVPGLTIRVEDLGKTVSANGKQGVKIQLMSLKNDKAIPLQYESEGIKKIISILQLLIVVYNRSSITVAIDELDSGIFEYLLGEMLRMISEKGKGQLIFTSHNLRPLETMDRGFIAFTTTNPANRYIRMSNVKENNNLRDFYFRDIILGEQSEEVYAPTNNAEIALAFREAGVRDGA